MKKPADESRLDVNIVRVYARFMSMPCHCRLVRTASRKMTAVYDAALEPAGINLAQYSMMRNIARAGAISLTDLGRKIELDRSTVGRNIKVLERMGVVESADSDDQREAVVQLSASGRATLKRAEPLWQEAQSRIEKKLGRKGIVQLHELLNAL